MSLKPSRLSGSQVVVVLLLLALTTEDVQAKSLDGGDGGKSSGGGSSISSEESPRDGIMCFPIMLNETDPESPDKVREVELMVCLPVPLSKPEYFPPTTTPEPSVAFDDIGGGAEETGAEGADDGDSVKGSDASTDAPIEVASYVAGRASEVQALTA
ncbi:uncharacterized protein [Drosophila bipectinata]|uniref:uncharacterized protein n=1 Tax=Drosophila bipectinata TaxID=42026 RepID=UPI001C8A658F|nr:uncharacterized protein LOC108125552 [Drosophila bipectinata]